MIQGGETVGMAKNRAVGRLCLNLCIVLIVFMGVCDSQESGRFDSYIISSFTYARTLLRPYEWRYIRVELPPEFSSMSLALESNADVDLDQIKYVNGSTSPIICLCEGSPPIPDVYNTSLSSLVTDYISNSSFSGNQSGENFQKCYPMQKNIFLLVTNEQIYPGTWYFGIFNGIGPMRTQSKMINRGSDHYFEGNITVEGCAASLMVGQFCNRTVNMLSCNNYNITGTGIKSELFIGQEKNFIACRNANGIVCHEHYEPKVYVVDVVRISEILIITASNVTFSQAQTSNITGNNSLMCYVRLGSMPLETVFDYSGDLNSSPLIISLPKTGRWYISIQPNDTTGKSERAQKNSLKACYLLEWLSYQCLDEKAGLNCTQERYMLQTVLRRNPSAPFESYYLPITGKISTDSPNFPLDPLASNFSDGESAWTYFFLGIPSAAAGGSLHIRLTSDVKINYEIYARYGGLPSLSDSDYFYVNATSNSNGSMFFKLYDSTQEKVSFYMLYAKGGTWTIGLRQPYPSRSTSPTMIALSLERCPQKCSSHGTCQNVLDTSGLALYSYCACDRNHGGFDCSVELVSHQGHIRQSIFLIASNVAAILPAFWALRSKAYAEWVLFTCSGISSALYHACDVGTWCSLSFHVLQFLDFWLSFMAVVSTFVYLAMISEVSKRTIHTIVAIVTALMAETGPTRSSNIVLVLAIGALGLLLGLLIELCTHYRSLAFPTEFHLNFRGRWESLKGWIHDLIKTLIKRFRWGFVLAGSVALAMAAISWKMESTESYWIWHSLWHVFIYTCSFSSARKKRLGAFGMKYLPLQTMN